jgi:hypothetical protein
MTSTTHKCDCGPCLCEVDLTTAIQKDGKYYCSEACANGHEGGTCCSQPTCNCGQPS